MSSVDKQLTVMYKVKGGNVMNDVFKPMFIITGFFNEDMMKNLTVHCTV